MVKIRQIFE